MKKLFFFAFVLIGLQGFAQVTDTTTYVYCFASCNSKVATSVSNLNDVNIFLDFGNGELYTPDHKMKAKEGFDLTFTSATTLTNYMAEKKWTLDKASSYYFGSGISGRSITNLIFKKPKYNKN